MEKKQNLERERELPFHLRLMVPSFLSRFLTHPAYDIPIGLLPTCNLYTYSVHSIHTTYELAVYVHTQIYFSLVTSS